MRFWTAALLATFGAAVATAIDIIEVKGRHFYNSKTGKPFFMKGVDYQPGGSASVKAGSDPLSDPEACARDIYLFQKLGVNTIRVYSVDPYINHDECMTMLAAAGIYLVLDVNSPLTNQHLYSMEPWTTYTPMYLKHIFEVVEVFSGYDNLLAFLSGNEVIHEEGSELVAPQYIKAVTRDLKGYMTNHIHRIIPVGYSNADHLDFRVSLAEYLECGDVGYVDFFAINSYQWCGDNTFVGSGYDKLVEHYSNYSIPLFFSEYGCNEVRPRLFQETSALFSELMTGVFSGGLVYEFTQEPSDYGLVKIAANKKDAAILKEFDTLAAVNAKLPNPVTIPGSASSNPRPVKCRDPDTYWNIGAPTDLPETLGGTYIEKGVEVDGKPKWTRGKFLAIKGLPTQTTYTIEDSAGKEIKDKKIKYSEDVTQQPMSDAGHGVDNGGGTGKPSADNGSSGTKEGAASASATVSLGSFVFVALAAVLAAF